MEEKTLWNPAEIICETWNVWANEASAIREQHARSITSTSSFTSGTVSFSRIIKADGELGAFHSGAPGAFRAFCKSSSFTARTVVEQSMLIAKDTGPELRMEECKRARTMILLSMAF
jgi:hypothetical protein